MQAVVYLLSALAFASAPAALAYNQCSQVPFVPGVDQSPSNPSLYGKCTSALEPFINKGTSHWCKVDGLGIWPDGPTDKAKQCLKFGRATIYRGPIYGSSPAHKAACKQVLKGNDRHAMVAVSTKYLKTYQGGWAADKGSCGQCMCVHLHGADPMFNPGLQRENAAKHLGLSFMAMVGDRCAECEDDHIDLLQDRPLTFAPFNPAVQGDNYNAPYVNAKDGFRGFSDPEFMRGHALSLENAGAWTADWQWAPCGWTHYNCAKLMKDVGYKNVFVPKWTYGVDSFSMRPVSQLRTANNDRLFKEPWSG